MFAIFFQKKLSSECEKSLELLTKERTQIDGSYNGDCGLELGRHKQVKTHKKD